MTASSKPPILVVDDFAPMGRIYRHFMKQMGLSNVDVATSGVEAIEMLERRRYAAIVSDWHMEPMTGFHLLQAVRADKAYRAVPFIMATVESRADHIKAAQRAGATDYILKPFNVATLRSALVNACPLIAAAMEPPILAVPARQTAARFREVMEQARGLPQPIVGEDTRLVEAFVGTSWV